MIVYGGGVETVYACVHSLAGEDSSCAKVLSPSQRESIHREDNNDNALERGATLQLHGSSPGLRNTKG